MKWIVAAVLLSGALGAPASAQSPSPLGPSGIATLSLFVGQWTCLVPKTSNVSLWTIAYEDDGQALHISVAGPSTAGRASHRDVFLVAHPPANDLYAFALGSTGWQFARSAAFDGKTLTFASIQSGDGRPMTQTIEIETPLSFSSKVDGVTPSGEPVSSTETCTKA